MRDVIAGLTRVLRAIAIAANVIGTLVVLVLVAVLNYDVIARGVFNAPFKGAYEVIQFSVVLIVFLQLPDVVRVGRLTRSDGFLIIAGHRRPRLGHTMRAMANAISCVFMLLVAIAIWPEFVEAWVRNDFFGVPGVFTAPWWPVKLAIFFSAALCTALFALKTVFGEAAAARRLASREDETS